MTIVPGNIYIDIYDAVLIKLLEISVIVSLRCVKSLLLLQIPVFFHERVRRGQHIIIIIIVFISVGRKRHVILCFISATNGLVYVSWIPGRFVDLIPMGGLISTFKPPLFIDSPSPVRSAVIPQMRFFTSVHRFLSYFLPSLKSCTYTLIKQTYIPRRAFLIQPK